MIQSIPMTARCNKIIDCEDGTDEVNCTCKDILMNVHPSAVCNGRVDCYDATDEKDCSNNFIKFFYTYCKSILILNIVCFFYYSRFLRGK